MPEEHLDLPRNIHQGKNDTHDLIYKLRTNAGINQNVLTKLAYASLFLGLWKFLGHESGES